MNKKEDLNAIMEYLKTVEGNEEAGYKSGKMEYTFVALKPKYVNYEVMNVVIKALNSVGAEIVFHAPVKYNKHQIQTHYKEMYESNNKFYPELEKYFASGMIYGMVVRGVNIVSEIKSITGSTKNPEEGSIRRKIFTKLNKEYNVTENAIHTSGTLGEAKNEIMNFLNAITQTPNLLPREMNEASRVYLIIDNNKYRIRSNKQKDENETLNEQQNEEVSK